MRCAGYIPICVVLGASPQESGLKAAGKKLIASEGMSHSAAA